MQHPYSVHPKLAKYAAGWDRYAAIAGNEDAELQQAYCAYLTEWDDWDGEPQRFDDWLAAQQEYAAAWHRMTGQACLPVVLLEQEFGVNPLLNLRRAYRAYEAVTPQPLRFRVWLAELARVAGVLDVPCVAIQSHQCCTPLRPMLRTIK